MLLLFDKFITYVNVSYRSTCRKKLCFNFLFSCVFLIKLGMFVSVIVLLFVVDIVLSCGCIVVNV